MGLENTLNTLGVCDSYIESWRERETLGVEK